jgi:biotin carboxyl carrier protein
LNGKKYEAIIEQEPGSGNVTNTASTASESATSPKTKTVAGAESIVAPMPGTILKTIIKEGQTVKKGDVLFILEAMKMENEIMVDHDAIVSKITVSNGASVNTGDCLALLK